jgi:hypothetical protein
MSLVNPLAMIIFQGSIAGSRYRTSRFPSAWEGSRARSFLLRRGFLLGLEGARGRGSRIADRKGRASRRHQTNVARKMIFLLFFLVVGLYAMPLYKLGTDGGHR